LQGVGTFLLGKLLLEIGRRQFIGAWIKLLQAQNLMFSPRPLRKPDGLFLVDAPGLIGVDATRRD
jgi:hypothetical protein